MPEYVLLICEDENGYATGGQEVFDRVMAGHEAFDAKWGSKVTHGKALQPTQTATTVRGDGAGGFTVTDGPFVETKEAMGGYYVVDAADLDEAIAIAKDIPAEFGCIEIRPVMTFD